MKLGDKVNFNFAKGKKFEVKEIVKDTNLPLNWEWSKKTCPHCDKVISNVKDYTIDVVHVLEEDNGDIIYIGYTKELINGVPLTMRLPDNSFHKDKDMSTVIKNKSKFLKEKNAKKSIS